MKTYKKLERHYRDMLDLEFTIQEGKLYMLQTRVGKRTGIAAVRIAVDLVNEGVITKREAVMRVGPEQLAQYLYPIFDPKQEGQHQPVGKGLPAGPGAAAGKIALTPERAVEMKERGERAILVRRETSPDDIHGMNASVGFLTAKGGMTSHAAVVARQMGKVCVAGCEALDVGADGLVRFGSRTLKEGDDLSINGFTGAVYSGQIPVVESEIIQVVQGNLKAEESEKYRYFSTLLEWADEFRTLGVRANADIPEQAIIARGFGAGGIGLCRTEHMFFAEDRVPIMQQMILAKTREDRERELAKLLPPRHHDAGDHPDASPGHHGSGLRGHAGRHQGRARDHDPAGRAGGRDEGPEGAGAGSRRRHDAPLPDEVPLSRGDHDRAAACGGDGRQDRPRGGLLLIRHERSHPDDGRLLPRRRREVHRLLHEPARPPPAVPEPPGGTAEQATA